MAALNRSLQGMRSASAAVSIDQGVQGPHGESHGRGRRPYSLDQLLSFTKLSLYSNEGSIFLVCRSRRIEASLFDWILAVNPSNHFAGEWTLNRQAM